MKFLVFLACCAYGCFCFAQTAHITVYTEEGCQYCEQLKSELSHSGLKYNVVLDTQGRFQAYPTTIVCNHGLCKRIEGDNLDAIIKAAK